jgi:hypothetical protein
MACCGQPRSSEAFISTSRHTAPPLSIPLQGSTDQRGNLLSDRIDTPGLGGLVAQHSAITWRYIPKAEAIFSILDSVEAVASSEEMDSLEKLRKMTPFPFLFFVQTRIDLVGTDQWKQWQDRNLQIIADTLQLPREKLLYFPVSARLKEIAAASHSPKALNESGYVPLLYFLHE